MSLGSEGERRLVMPAFWRDRGRRPYAVFGALVLAGFVVLAVSWRGVAREADVALQIPYVVSGGLGGIGLILVGCALTAVQVARRSAVNQQLQLDVVIQAVESLTRDLR